ncbi:MAG: ATP-binding cassette domain-containing protein [Candidatus Firestonebacteria bacterium]|nr:ATP-binding cassette domain-containing protein [Candidatus Firestonebacteria bacterium]
MENLIEVKNLKTYYSLPSGFFSKKIITVKAVDDISFVIPKGKTVGLVGESGCGKTTVGKSILRLIPATSGKILYKGEDILEKTETEMRTLCQKMQIFFQDPYGSLNPRMTVEEIVGEPLIIHKLYSNRKERYKRVLSMMNTVGLGSWHMKKYPHEFSGGQRQRIGIARALILNPDLVIADEPVSAIDVSIQAQIINLLLDLSEELKLTYLFISHDLRIIQYVSDYVIVMYLGKIMEISEASSLYKKPLHPYTQSLLASIPIPDPEYKKVRKILEGDIPSPIDIPDGCRFYSRCPEKEELCKIKEPELKEMETGHFAACHHASTFIP